jgi:hypothetical protein
MLTRPHHRTPPSPHRSRPAGTPKHRVAPSKCAIARSFDPQEPLFFACFSHPGTSWRHRNTIIRARFEVEITSFSPVWGSKTHHSRSFGSRFALENTSLALVRRSKSHHGAIKTPSSALEPPSCRRDPRSKTDHPPPTPFRSQTWTTSVRKEGIPASAGDWLRRAVRRCLSPLLSRFRVPGSRFRI